MKRILIKLVTYGFALFYGSLVLVSLLFRWLRHPTRNMFKVKERTTPPNCLTDSSLGEHRFLQLKSVKIHYVEKGNPQKPLMLFVHGFPEFWYSWRHQIREFSKDYWTVSIDMRGYGDSDKPKKVEDYRKSALVEDLKELITALGKEKCILVAHDWGGAIAWSFVMKYPQMIERYVIMNAPHSLAYKDAVVLNKKQFFLSWYMFFFQLPFLPELNLRLNDMSMFKMLRAASKSSSITDEDLEAYKYTFGTPGALTPPINYYRANLIGAVSKDGPSRIEKISVPGLLIWGTKDFYLDKRIAEYSKKYADNLTVEYIEGANHFVQQDDPIKTNAVMRKYLQS